MALIPSRSQISRPRVLVTRASGGRPIRLNVWCTRSSGNTFRNGDCSSWIASACLSVPSKTGSPAVLTKSVTSTRSRSVRAWAPRKWKKVAPATAATSRTKAATRERGERMTRAAETRRLLVVAACGVDSGRGHGRAARGGGRRRRADRSRAPRFAVALETPQVGLEVGRGLVAQPRVLLEALQDDPLELRRHLGIEPQRRRGRPVQDGVEEQRRGAGRRRPGGPWPSRRAPRRRRRCRCARRARGPWPARATCRRPFRRWRRGSSGAPRSRSPSRARNRSPRPCVRPAWRGRSRAPWPGRGWSRRCWPA